MKLILEERREKEERCSTAKTIICWQWRYFHRCLVSIIEASNNNNDFGWGHRRSPTLAMLCTSSAMRSRRRRHSTRREYSLRDDAFDKRTGLLDAVIAGVPQRRYVDTAGLTDRRFHLCGGIDGFTYGWPLSLRQCNERTGSSSPMARSAVVEGLTLIVMVHRNSRSGSQYSEGTYTNPLAVATI